MPFQSEKQRRYLHANHPEIAKRWEKEYATGGISNHFRKRFFTGALADTQGPAGGQAMSPGTSTTGGSRNIEGGQGNQGNQNGGSGPKPHSGPTLAEIEAQKKAKALADAKAKAELEAAKHKAWIDRKDKKKKKVDWAKKNWEDYKALGTVPLNLAKGLFGNIKNPGEVTQVTLTDAMKENLINKAKNKNTLTGNIDYTDYNTPTKTFTGLNKFMDPIDIANALTMGGTNFTTDELGNIDFTGGAYDFNKGNVITNFIDQGGMTGLAKKLGAEKIGEKIYDWTAAKGGVARKNYYHGGILDINESEEIISDDGNDIELTAYNAAFDDPNDLSTGVKTLFMKKGGNVRLGPHTATDLLAKKNPDGTRSKYQPPGHKDAPAHHGDVAHGPGGRFDQPSAPTTTTSTGDGPKVAPGEGPVTQAEIDLFNKGERTDPDALNMQDYLTDEQEVNEQKIQERNEAWLDDNPRWKDTIDQHKNLQYKKNIDALVDSINNQLDVRLANKAISYVIEKAAMAHPITTIAYGIAKLFGWKPPTVSTDLSGNIIDKNYVTGADLGFFDPDEYPEFWGKGPDDTGGDGPEVPQVIPVGEEIDAYAQSDYYMSPWERIKANQAKRAMLVEKGIIQENPVVDESVTDITMQANSGGLANLFRVKNQ
jgi:hypothetical protein